MTYFKYNVSLTEGQKRKLAESHQKKTSITLRLKSNQLHGSEVIMLTKRQINKIEKSKLQGTGVDIKISATQIRKQQGGSLFSSILPMLTRVGTTALPWFGKVAAPLAQGALSGLGSLGINKLFGGSGYGQGGSGLFSVPQDKVDKLIKYKSYLTQKQKEQIVSALQSGSGMTLKLTRKQQSGGFLGTLLASLGIPMLVKALGGGLQVGSPANGYGLQVDRPSGAVRNIYVPQGGDLITYPHQPPPFFGTWSQTHGYGIKKKTKSKKKGKGILLGPNSPFKNIPLVGAIL